MKREYHMKFNTESLCKNILHQLLLLTGIQQGKQLFTNLLARLRYIQNS